MPMYAVRKGRRTGIFGTWAECEEQVKGFSGAEFRKFDSYDEALKYIEGADVTYDLNPNMTYAYIDGTYNSADDTVGYGIVFVKDNRVWVKDCGKEKADSNGSKNIHGEVLAAMRAIQLAMANDIKELVLAYDYDGIEAWATGKWKTYSDIAKKYKEFVDRNSKNIRISFMKCYAHTGNHFNEIADELAKKALMF